MVDQNDPSRSLHGQLPLTYAAPAIATYESSGRVSAVGLLAMLGGGVLVAILVGTLVAVVLFLDVRVPFIVLYVGPGAVIGLAVSGMIRRAKVRSRAAVRIVSVTSALSAVIAVFLSFYVGSVLMYRNNVRDYWQSKLAQGALPDTTANRQVIDEALASPFRMYDYDVLMPAHQRGGIAGFLVSMQPAAQGVLYAVGIGTLITSLMLTKTAVAKGPFCEACNTWFSDPVTIAVLPFDWRDDVVRAIESNDTAKVRSMRSESYGGDFGVACTSVRRHTCPGCSATLVDVMVVAPGESVVMKPRRVDEAMLEAMKPPESEDMERNAQTV